MVYGPFVLFVLFSALVCYIGCKIAVKAVLHFNPARSIKTLGIALFQTLSECGCISSSAKVVAKADKHLGYVDVFLRNASIHDQNIFNTAMTELLSPIDNPRYILIRKQIFNRYHYQYAFACPSVIGKKKSMWKSLPNNCNTAQASSFLFAHERKTAEPSF